jgi:ABC-type lipoprotein release transport system permease subunit
MNDSNSSPDSTQQKFSKRQESRTLSIILFIAAILLIGVPGILIGTYLGNKWILIATAIVYCALGVSFNGKSIMRVLPQNPHLPFITAASGQRAAG